MNTIYSTVPFGVEVFKLCLKVKHWVAASLLSSSLSLDLFLRDTLSFINLLLRFASLTLSPSSLPLHSTLPSLLVWPDAYLRLFPTRWLIYHYIITASPLLHPDVTRVHTSLELFQYPCISTDTLSLPFFSRFVLHTYLCLHGFSWEYAHVFFSSRFNNWAISES